MYEADLLGDEHPFEPVQHGEVMSLGIDLRKAHGEDLGRVREIRAHVEDRHRPVDRQVPTDDVEDRDPAGLSIGHVTSPLSSQLSGLPSRHGSRCRDRRG